MKTRNYLEMYEQHLLVGNKTHNSIVTYLSSVNEFLEYIESDIKNESITKAISFEMVQEFIRKSKAKGHSSTSINLKLTSISSFCEFLKTQNMLPDDFKQQIKELRFKKISLIKGEFLTEDEYKLLNDLVSLKGNYKHIIILYLMVKGIKATDIINIRLSDVVTSSDDGPYDHIRIRYPDCVEKIEVDKLLQPSLEELFRHRLYQNSGNPYLLVSERKQPYQLCGIRFIINSYFIQAGISTKKHKLNTLRLHYISQCILNNIPISAISARTSLSNDYVTRISKIIKYLHKERTD